MSLQYQTGWVAMNKDTINEFSRTYNLDVIRKSGSNITLKATYDECVNLAVRYDIPAVSSLSAECQLKKMAQKDNGDYELNVKLSATIVQRCVLTLEDMEERISERFSIIFKQSEEAKIEANETQEVDFELEDDDIEYIEDTEVDVGEYVAEYLSLSINPYPKKANATANKLGHDVVGDDEFEQETKRENPFTILKDL